MTSARTIPLGRCFQEIYHCKEYYDNDAPLPCPRRPHRLRSLLRHTIHVSCVLYLSILESVSVIMILRSYNNFVSLSHYLFHFYCRSAFATILSKNARPSALFMADGNNNDPFELMVTLVSHLVS